MGFADAAAGTVEIGFFPCSFSTEIGFLCHCSALHATVLHRAGMLQCVVRSRLQSSGPHGKPFVLAVEHVWYYLASGEVKKEKKGAGLASSLLGEKCPPESVGESHTPPLSPINQAVVAVDESRPFFSLPSSTAQLQCTTHSLQSRERSVGKVKSVTC